MEIIAGNYNYESVLCVHSHRIIFSDSGEEFPQRSERKTGQQSRASVKEQETRYNFL
jgi:hypothetical protein